MRNPFLVLAALLCSSCVLVAQAAPEARAALETRGAEHYQLYAGYSYLSNSFNGVPGHRQSLNGWDLSLAFPYIWRGLRFKADYTKFNGSNYGGKQDSFALTGGFQYEHKIWRETAFGELMAGDIGIGKYWGPNGARGQTASFTTIMGGGLDTPISRRFAIRASGDFVYSNFYLQNEIPQYYNRPVDFPGKPNYFGRVTAGLVWKF